MIRIRSLFWMTWALVLASVIMLVMSTFVWVFHEREELKSIETDFRIIREQIKLSLTTVDGLHGKLDEMNSKINDLRKRLGDVKIEQEEQRQKQLDHQLQSAPQYELQGDTFRSYNPWDKK